MGVVDDRREGCDGCGRTVALEDLTAISMPDGARFACCPRCEPHARTAAEKFASLDTNRARCDGCRDEYPAAKLDDVVLTDGTVITVCPSCLGEVPGRGDGSTDTAVHDADDPDTTELATRRHLCGNCHGWFEQELYHVTLADGRTEELCDDCKTEAEREGIVAEVKLRAAEAREILEVGPDATDRELRRAFLTQVKHAHPDRRGGTTGAFKLVKEAYDRLS